MAQRNGSNQVDTPGMANNIGLGGIRGGDDDASYNPAGPDDNPHDAIDSGTEGNVDVAMLAGVGAVDSNVHPVDDWHEEDVYWQENFPFRPYALQGVDYETYRAAYRYGVYVADQYEGKPFETLSDDELRSGWEAVEVEANLSWPEAREAVRDAYNRRRRSS